MSIEQVGATTVTNIGGNHRKFYTIHVIGSTEVRQYGRIGTTGQCQVINHSGKRAAEQSAEEQITKKERGGYSNRQNVVYALDDRFLSYAKGDLLKIVHDTHLAAQAGISGLNPDMVIVDDPWERPDDPQPETSAEAAFASFSERALNVIGATAAGGTEAATTYVALREEFEGFEGGLDRCRSLLETLEVMLTSGGES